MFSQSCLRMRGILVSDCKISRNFYIFPQIEPSLEQKQLKYISKFLHIFNDDYQLNILHAEEIPSRRT